MPASLRQLDRRAQGVSSFFIQDNSPLLTYSRDDWTLGYAPQPNGYDQTLHMTAKSGSRVSFNLAASSLTLLVPAYDNCTAIISINSSDPITACSTRMGDSNDVPFSLYSLPLGTHSVYWDTGNVHADTDIIFWGIDGTRPAEPAGFANVTIDNTFQQSTDGQVKLEYAGTWQSIAAESETDLSEKDSLDKYFNKTLSVTTQSGASVAFTGKGSAVYAYGNVGPDYGAMTVSVNDQVVESSLNLTSPWAMPYELLWYRTGLDPDNPTEVIMTSLAESKMSLDFVLFTTGPETVSVLTAPIEEPKEGFASSLAGKVVLMFLIPVVALTLLAFLLFILFRRRRARQAKAMAMAEQHQRQYSQSSTAGFKYPDGSDGGGRWSAEPKSSRYSTHSEPSEADLVFVSYDEGKGQRMSEHWNKQSFNLGAAGSGSGVGTSSSETAWNHEEQEVVTPRSARSGASRSPPMELRSLPQSVRGSSVPAFSVADEHERGGASGSEQYHGEDERSETQSTWGRPFEAMTGGRFPVSLPGSRRGTLPAYSADGDTIPPVPTPPQSASVAGTENASVFGTADAEKRVLQAAYSGYNTPTSPLGDGVAGGASVTANGGGGDDNDVADPDGTPGPSHKRLTHQTHTSAAPSIISVFGSPPSEARRSVARTPAPRNSIPRPPSKIDMSFLKRKPPPDMPLPSPSPTSSRVPFPSSPESTRVHPKSSMPATAEQGRPPLPPPTSFQEVNSDKETAGTGLGHIRNRSLGGISARTDVSAARPDSVIIPFEDFVQSLGSSPVDGEVIGGPSSNYRGVSEGRSSPLVPRPE